MNVSPVTLAGRHVRLEPMSPDHLGGLAAVGLDQDLWRWTTTLFRTPEEMRSYVEQALEEQARGVSLPFVTVERESGRMTTPTGRLRHTVYFSVTHSEWPAVRARLEEKLSRPPARG